MSWSRWRDPSRRAFLGGLGAAITLPFLPSLLPRGARADARPPVRLVFWYVPNGMHMPAWTPSAEGDVWDLTPSLAPLAAVRDDVTVLSGMTNLSGRDEVRPGDHARGTGAFLTALKPTYEGVSLGVSVDQAAAAHNGSQTTFPSLQLGTEGGPSLGSCDSGYACSYSRNISWTGPTTPLPKQTNPAAVFDRLFAGFDGSRTEEERARRLIYRKSVLDAVVDDATAVQAQVAPADRHRLDEYLTGVRELELRLSRGDVRQCTAPYRPAPQLDIEAHIDAMSDLTAIALQCDLTRYITFMLGDAGSNRNYSFLGASGAHHEISHHQDLQENWDKLTLINAWEVERFAVLLSRLRGLSEGDGTVLDSTLVLLGSDVSDGNRHNHDDMPLLLAGRGGGVVQPGRHLRLDGRPMADLFLTMLHAVGSPAAAFGADGMSPVDLA